MDTRRNSLWLKNAGIDPATLNLKQIEEHLDKLTADKDALTASYSSKENKIEQLRKAEENLYKFLDVPTENRTIPSQEKEPVRNPDRNRSL